MASAAQPVVAQEQHQQACYFPIIPQVGQKYAQVAQAALALYNDNYTAEGTYNFFAKAEEITGVVEKWTARHDLVVKGTTEDQPSMETLRTECGKKLVEYIAFRHIRDETARIVEVFNEAIQYLTLTAGLDTHTLVVLKLCGIDVGQVEKRVASIFGTVQVQQQQSLKEQLVAKRQELTQFHTDMCAKCALLRKSLEPLARHTAPGGYSIGAAVSWMTESVGQTPYVNALVQNHDITKAKAKQTPASEEHKE